LQFHAVACADGAVVRQPVRAQFETPFPVQEIEAVLARLAHQFAQFRRRQRANCRQRMHVNPEQHFVLDDVADAGEDFLVEQRVANQCIRMRAQALQCEPRVPAVGQHVAAPVVQFVHGSFEIANRTGVEVQFAARETQLQARRLVGSLVDAVAAEHQQMDAQHRSRCLDQELLAEAAQTQDALAPQPLHVDLGIARGGADMPAAEGTSLFLEQYDRRSFGHGDSFQPGLRR